MNRPQTLEEARVRKLAYIDATKHLSFEDKPGRDGFSTNEMHVMFTKVQNPQHWKLPVDKTLVMTLEEVAIVKAAVIDFTGGQATVTSTGNPNEYRVRARGYFNCIGA